MKLLRVGSRGYEKPAVLDNSGTLRDLSSIAFDIAGPILLPDFLAELESKSFADLPVLDLDDRIGACVGNVGKFICIGLNYADHAEEAGTPIPAEPIVFSKWTSAISGPNDPVIKPKGSIKLDWEVELGIVIGKSGVYINESDAEDHIAGYCVVNDVSERYYQLECGGQWSKGKGCDSFGPIGPWLVTKNEIKDPTNLSIWLEVNGKPYQNGNTKTMIFKPNFIVSYLSRFMSLQPGDIISTGTPRGVGMAQSPPKFLDVGDTMRLGIEGLGQQVQTVIAAK